MDMLQEETAKRVNPTSISIAATARPCLLLSKELRSGWRLKEYVKTRGGITMGQNELLNVDGEVGFQCGR